MRQAVSAETNAGCGFNPHACSTARPQFPQGAKFGDRQEFIGIGCHQKRNSLPRLLERKTARFEQTQIGNAGGDRESEFLRLRAAGLMHRASIGAQQMSVIEALRAHILRCRAGACR